jgi:hypothetical protein
VQEDSNWNATVKALSNYKEVAKKANSPEDLKRAAELHALAYMKDILSLDANHPLVSTFPNLKSHWYKVYEDLTDMYLAGKYLNMDPNDLTEILGSLSYLDNEIIQRFSGTDELRQWIENRRYQRKDCPALRDLEQM